jgi:hypothetical protein
VQTKEGPRYQLEGVAELGRLLALDDGAKWASPVGIEPLGAPVRIALVA